MTPLRTPQWWLAAIDRHGNARLVDGPHDARKGANRAAYLMDALGLAGALESAHGDVRYAVARVELSEPQPSSKGVNHAAIDAINGARR